MTHQEIQEEIDKLVEEASNPPSPKNKFIKAIQDKIVFCIGKILGLV